MCTEGVEDVVKEGSESRAAVLTSDIAEVDGLSVGVEELDDRVVVVLHSAADGRRLSLNHGHIVCTEILPFNCRGEKEKWEGRHYRTLPVTSQ